MTGSEPAPQRSIPSRIFLSPDEPRLRAGWRLALQTLLLLAIGLLVSLVAIPITFLLKIDSNDLLFGQAIETIVFTSSILLARWLLDRRSIASLGLKLGKWVLNDVLAGILITFFMMGFIFLVELGLGWLHFEGFVWQNENLLSVLSHSLALLFIFSLVSWNEELLSRGYHLQTIASGTNLFFGVVISSAVFGILHLGNPNATWISASGIFLAGLFLAYAYITTKQLWLSIGLHLGWNFFEGVGFGFPVSGLDIYRLIRITVHGPELWTGGAFGPEAGLVVLPGLTLGALLIYVYARYIRNRTTPF